MAKRPKYIAAPILLLIGCYALLLNKNPGAAAPRLMGVDMLLTDANGGSLVWATLGIIVVIAGAYYATHLVAKKANSIQQGRAVRVLDRFGVGKDKLFCLISMGDKIYLVGMAEGAITVIDKLEGPEAEEIRAACEQSLKNTIIRRGASVLGNFLSARRFNAELDQARRRMEHGSGEVDVEQLALKFAREEDDLDAVLRKLDTRKKNRDSDGEGEGTRQ